MKRRAIAASSAAWACALLAAMAGCTLEAERVEKQVQASKPADPCPKIVRVKKDHALVKACSPYEWPSGGIDIIDGATLTIEAGVELRMNDGDWLEVGAAGEPGRLIAKGTPEAPIVITTNSPDTPKRWLGVWFHSGTLPGSVLEHAVVRGGGGNNRHPKPPLLQGCVTLTGVKAGALKLHDVRAEGCLEGGFRFTKSEPAISQLSVADTTEGFVMDAAAVGLLDETVRYQNVSHNVITGGAVTADARWAAQPLPFFVKGDVVVEGAASPTLTLAPGIILEFDGSRALRVGDKEPGALRAEGTSEAPIELRSKQPEAPWAGVSFGRKTAAQSSLAGATIRGTSSEAAVMVRSEADRVKVKDVTFLDNAADVLVGCGSKPALAGNKHQGKSTVKREAPCR